MKAKREPQEVNLDECPQESWSPEQLGRYCQVAHRKVTLYAHQLGKAFMIARETVGHGGWIKWLKTYGFNVETARRYRLLAENFTEEEVAEVGLMDAFHVLGINNGAKKAVKGPKQGSESTASDKPAAPPKEMAGGPQDTGRRAKEPTTDEGDNQLTPREELVEELRDGLPHLIVQLRKLVSWVMAQDCNLRIACWLEVGSGPVAMEVAGLKEDLNRLLEDMPAEAIRKAG